ncbi:serine/threonine-protein kinase [Streptomyces sp. NPDC048718]|uniref:serine/threonine-protein kinase n=1 Tax=Streptomyces sp. NPDC048718 TaxID=3365587 RepID=UPI00371EDD8A
MDPLSAQDPSSIGPFRLLGRLGAGGMGRVYLGRSAGGRVVAVKVVHAQLAAEEEFRLRFAREVAALEKMGGVGTAPVLGADTEARTPWVAVAYVPGPSLRTVVGDDHGPLPPYTVRGLAAGLARALTHIHAAGLVHRDLKPANVLLTVDGPQIIDFGIARALDTVTNGGLTATGAVVGSPGFMSPEQVRGEKVTPASDIFCLGSVLAYAAAGRVPFGGSESGLHSTMFRIAHEEPDLAGVAPEITGLIRACLAKDPAGRPTAADLAGTLTVTDPWLPAAVLARLGRHAARLLEAEDPAPAGAAGTYGEGAAGPVPEPLPTSETAVEPTPTPTPAPGPGPNPNPSPAPAPGPLGDQAPTTVPRRRRRGLLLGATAVVVAGALGLAYTFWPQPGSGATDGGSTAYTGATRPPGIIPTAFLGAWEGVLKGTADLPNETVRIEITQGAAGARTAVYTHTTEELLCIGRAVLKSANDSELVLGEGEITASIPERRCTPSARQTLRLRSNDVVEWSSGAAKATFQRARSGPSAVPAALLGDWKATPLAVPPPGEAERYGYYLTISQGPVGAPLVRFEQRYPRMDAEGNPTSEDTHCVTTAVVAGAGPLLVIGPETRDPDVWDDDCVENGPSSLRIVRVKGKDHLFSYGLVPESEPSDFERS